MALLVLFVAVAAYTGGVGAGWPLLQHLAFALAALEVLSLAWVLLGRIGLTAFVQVDRTHTYPDEPITESIEVQRGRWLPWLWVEIGRPEPGTGTLIEAESTQLGLLRTRVFSRRGRYRLGGEVMRVRDPFGLFAVPAARLPSETVTIFPRPVAVPGAAMAAIARPRQQRSIDSADATLGELRPYVPGDPPSRIHWRSTARVGSLIVAQPESHRRAALWIAADLGGGEEAAEASAGMASYIAEQLWESGHEIGAAIAGTEVVVLPPSRRRDQLTRILEALAVTPSSPEPRRETLMLALRRVERGQIAVLIGGAESRAGRPSMSVLPIGRR